MSDTAAALVDEKRTLSKKLGESLKKSFTPRSSRASTPADLSAATTPKAGAPGPSSAPALASAAVTPAGSSSPRDAKTAARAAKEAVSKKAATAAADAKAAASKAGKNVQKAAKDTRAALEADDKKGFKVIGATLVAAAAAVAGFLLYKEHEEASKKPEPVPAKKKGLFGK